LLDRQVLGFLAFEDFVHVECGVPIHVIEIEQTRKS